MPSQSEITKGAFDVIAGISGLPDIAWPNVDFTPADEFVAVDLLPAESEAETVGCDALMGLIQASVHIRDGIGIIDALVYTDLIRAAFPKGLEVTNGATKFVITKTPWDAPKLMGNGWVNVPVSIPFKTIN